jgi:hypothetical protein
MTVSRKTAVGSECSKVAEEGARGGESECCTVARWGGMTLGRSHAASTHLVNLGHEDLGHEDREIQSGK